MDTVKKVINAMHRYGPISKAELARRLNTTPQGLRSKLVHGMKNVNDLERVADALGVELVVEFVERSDE